MMPMHSRAARASRESGFSLIELLISMAIGLIVTLAITSVLIRSESDKRTNSSVNDVDQTGTYATFVLDRIIRSAGSGFAQSRGTVFGCTLDVKKTDGTVILPMPAAISSTGSPFLRVTAAALPIRLAPVIIAKNLADTTGGAIRGDVLMVMSGTAGYGESARPVLTGSVTSSALLLSNTLGYSTDDLVLLSDPGVAGGCKMQQVGTHLPTSTDQSLPLAGIYNATNGTGVNLSAFGANTIALQMGNASATTPNMPQFQLLGVGDNNTLSSYDLLQYSATAPESAIAEGVSEMHALYGVDNDVDGKIDLWVDPGTTGWDPTTLMNNPAKLRQITAIRIGLILRSSLQEKEAVIGPTSPSTRFGTVPLTLTLFSDLYPSAGAPAPYTRTYAAGTVDLSYRYRTFEITIPLRNVTLAP